MIVRRQGLAVSEVSVLQDPRGFNTDDTERIMGRPLRRRIVRTPAAARKVEQKHAVLTLE